MLGMDAPRVHVSACCRWRHQAQQGKSSNSGGTIMETTQKSNASTTCPDGEGGRTSPRKRLAGVLAAGVLAGSTLFVGFAPAQAVSTGVAVDNGVLKIAASPGKNNNITVTPYVQGGKAYYRVTDTGDSVVAGNQCAKLSNSAIRCAAAGVGSVQVDSGSGNDTVRLTSVTRPSQVKTGSGNDVVYGGTNRDVVSGEAGNDTLHGQGGDDRLDGGPGNDYLLGGTGNDVLVGQDGNDHLYGGSGNDYLMGGLADDVLLGQDGDDTVWGQDGNDTLYGGAGDDTLYGNAGNDKLHGQAGKDKHYGGTGNDTLNGVDAVAFNDYLNGEQGFDKCEADGGDTVLNCDVVKRIKAPSSAA
ncbi:calcium-binding protein [Kocuria nitroreducens]|uniref:calcium-binding protein n=1 Tax=Kocuria nitroreducens TaxID=3058914 RepID=UPI0036DBBAAE